MAADREPLEPRPGEVSPASRGPGRRVGPSLVPLGVLAIAFLVYLSGLGNEFVFDDLLLVKENERIRTLENLPEILGFTGKPAYRPLRTASYALDYHLFGYDPRGYRLFNILYHSIAAFFVFLVTRALVGATLPAFLAAALFTVHPVQTESVTYIAGRRDILFGLFYLIGFHAFVMARRRGRPAFLVLTVACYSLSFLAKEMAITLPLVCLAHELSEEWSSVARATGRAPGVASMARSVARALWRRRLFYGGMGALALWFAVSTVLNGAASRFVNVAEADGRSLEFTFHGGSFAAHALTIPRIALYYLRILFWPATLLQDHSYNAFPTATSLWEPYTLASIAGLALGLGALYLSRGKRELFFPGAWFLLTLLPVLQLVPHHEIAAIHYLYVPVCALAFAAAFLLERCGRNRLIHVVSGSVVLLLAARTAVRNLDWRDEATLYLKNIEDAPECVRSHLNLARYSAQIKGEWETALREVEIALELDKKDPTRSREPSIRNLVGYIHLKTGAYERAEVEYKRAIDLRPNAANKTNLGVLYGKQGRSLEAVEVYQKVVREHPRYARAYAYLGEQYFVLRRYAEAEDVLNEATERDPSLVEAYVTLARLYAQTGRQSEARRALSTAQEAARARAGK